MLACHDFIAILKSMNKEIFKILVLTSNVVIPDRSNTYKQKLS